MLPVLVRFYSRCKEFKPSAQQRALLKACCAECAAYTGLKGYYEVSVTFTDDEGIRILNSEHRGIDAPTDVLSFPLSENGDFDINPENGRAMLGDIVVSYQHMQKQALEFGHPQDRELAFLTVHAMLHLLGFDHIKEEDEKKMREAQRAVLARCGQGLE